MSDVTLDTQAFFKRVGKIFAAYDEPTAGTEDLADLAGIQIIMGEPNDDGLSYSKSSAMQVSPHNYTEAECMVALNKTGSLADDCY